MMVGRYSRTLLTFAFVRQEFDRTGDVIRGLMPLFEPIFSEMDGDIFSPREFAVWVERLYGIKMHPYVAEDWVPRFKEAGLLQKIVGDQYSESYRCKGLSLMPASSGGEDVAAIVDSLTDHAEARLRESRSDFPRAEIEAGIIKRLYKPEFLALLTRPQETFFQSSTLTLSRKENPDTPVGNEAQLDFILADRLLALSNENRPRFEAITDIAGGALVSEVVLALRSPPRRGATARGMEVYIDSPLLLDLLDVSIKQDHEYVKLLVDDLKAMGVSLRTFEHNVQEIRGIFENALGLYSNVRAATGEVANRLRTDRAAVSRVQMIRSNIAGYLSGLGVHVRDMEKVTANTAKYFPEDRLSDLISQIRPFGSIFSREVDAKSLAGVSRMVLGRKAVSNVFSLPALFLTKNAGLATLALRYIREGYNYEEAAPPFITDRQMAGLTWLARGGEAGDVSTKQLLANCTRAIAPRRDVLARVYEFLAEVDENTAKQFEAMMVEDRCSHYVMSYTLGDAALVTKDNAYIIFEEVKRRAIADTLARSGEETARMLQEKQREADAALKNQADRLEAQIADLVTQSNEQKLALSTRDIEILGLRSSQEGQSTELSEAQATIQELQRATVIAASDAARNSVTRTKIVISAIISLMLAIVGAVGSYLTGIVTDRFWLSLIVLIVMLITGTLTFTVAWAIPDIIFGRMLTRKAEEKYRHEIRRRGAEAYAARWRVDLSDSHAALELIPRTPSRTLR